MEVRRTVVDAEVAEVVLVEVVVAEVVLVEVGVAEVMHKMDKGTNKLTLPQTNPT